jgi:hypothetical protein
MLKKEEDDYVNLPNLWAFPGPITDFAFATGFEQGIFVGLNLDGPLIELGLMLVWVIGETAHNILIL